MQKRQLFFILLVSLYFSGFSQEPVGSFEIQYNTAPKDVRAVVKKVAENWSQLIKSDLPIRVSVEWRDSLVIPISPEGVNSVAAACAPGSYSWGINNKKTGNDTLYPIALAEKLSGRELNDGKPDIIMYINEIRLLTLKAKDTVIRWYYGTNGILPHKFRYDLYSVLLHEFAHGLGFQTSVQMQLGSASKAMFADAPSVFDYFVVDSLKRSIVSMGGEQLFKTVTNKSATKHNLFFSSPLVHLCNNDSNAILYAEPQFHVGRAVCHFSDTVYRAGDKNSLMSTTFDFNQMEVNHNIGPLAAGVLATIGWTEAMFNYSFPKGYYPVDKPATFSLAKNTYLNDNGSKLHVSLDGFASDSVIQMVCTDSARATLSALSAVNYRVAYYIESSGASKTSVTFPTNAPQAYFSYLVGKDKTPPTINHTPITSVTAKNGSARDISLLACVFDAGKVDSVWIEYSVNKSKFTQLMKASRPQIYESTIVKTESFVENDSVIYKICARDKSGNISSTVMYRFKITANPNVSYSYSNDFSDTLTLADFKIGYDAVAKKSNFTISDINGGSKALQTPHGYRNALDWETAKIGERDSVVYTAVLDRLIVLKRGYAYIDFDEIVLVEPGEVGTVWGDQQFWDYVIVEGSKDAGATWRTIELSGGYDASNDSAWLTRYYSKYTHIKDIHYISDAVGDASLYRHHRINILENKRFRDGDTMMVRFRLYSDSYTYAWGWAIDNLNIQKGATDVSEKASFNSCRLYPNPSSNKNIVIELNDYQGKDIQIVVTDLVGRTVYLKDYTCFSGVEVMDAGLAPGVYTVQLLSAGTVVGASRLVIQ